MENVTFIEVTDPITSVATTYAIIDRGNGEFTSMAKALYDTLPSNSSIPQAGE
jgi:hypothetical protein